MAVVLAAGSGTRMGADRNKAYLPLAGRHMVSWSLQTLADVSEVARIVLVIRTDDRPSALEALARDLPGLRVEIIDGGASRHDSEYRALTYLAPDIASGAIDVVLLHDAARPLAGAAMMRSAVDVARRFGGAIPGIETYDLATVDTGGNLEQLGSDHRFVRVQTPQAFRARTLLDAYAAAAAEGFEGTDTSSSVERFADPAAVEVHVFPGDPRNMKVTFARDRHLAERLLADVGRA